MLVTPPRAPSRATGRLDTLLTDAGHPPLASIDEERDSLASAHDDLFEEISALARRGWAVAFDAETGSRYDAKEYEQVLATIVRPLGIERVSFDDDAMIVRVDDRPIQVHPPEQDDDWLDVSWIFDVASLAIVDSTWVLVAVDDFDMHQVIVGTVPRSIWEAMCDQGLCGSWRAAAMPEASYN